MKKLIGWTVKFTKGSDGLCCNDRKIIFVGVNYNDGKEGFMRLLLHEIAHIPKIRRCHSRRFWNKYEHLLKKYLNSKMTSYDKKVKKFYC